MAIHKFIAVTDGGYFYRFYPKIKEYHGVPKDGARLLLFAPPPAHHPTKQFFSLFGKFHAKYASKKDFVIELEHSGEITIQCNYTTSIEKRELSSVLIIQVPETMYSYPFVKGKLYSITTDEITEL